MLPAESRAAVQTARGVIEVKNIPIPEIGEDDALLRVELCGICGTDIEQFHGRLEEMGWSSGPRVPGHEPLGHIAAIGPQAARRWGVGVGDRVVVEPLIPCETCESCRSGEYVRCDGWGQPYGYGVPPLSEGPGLWGGYSEYLYLHPNSRVHPIPEHMDRDIAVLVNPMAAGVRWVVTAPDLRLGQSVLIMGAGQRGLCGIVAARAVGAGTVIATDLSAARHKLDLALQMGADQAIAVDEENTVDRVLEITSGRGVDVVVDVTRMAMEPLEDAMRVVRPGGTIVVSGIKGQNRLSLDTDLLMRRSITMKGVFAVESRSYRDAIHILGQHGDRLRGLRTATYPLEGASQAISHLAGQPGVEAAVHVAIDPTIRSEVEEATDAVRLQ